MKYFLFNNGFPYYGLIVAENQKKATEEYTNVVCDLEEGKYKMPIELSQEEVLNEIEEADFESLEEKDEIINKVKNNGFVEREVLLIDSSLI